MLMRKTMVFQKNKKGNQSYEVSTVTIYSRSENWDLGTLRNISKAK